MLDFTCCIIFFNYYVTEVCSPSPCGRGRGEGISPHRTFYSTCCFLSCWRLTQVLIISVTIRMPNTTPSEMAIGIW